MNSLLDSVKALITPGVVQGLASSSGESAGSIEKGLLGSSATMLATLAGRAQDNSFLATIMNLISNFTTRGLAMGAAAGASSSSLGGSTASSTSQIGSTFLNA